MIEEYIASYVSDGAWEVKADWGSDTDSGAVPSKDTKRVPGTG